MMVTRKSSQWLGKNTVQRNPTKELQQTMDRCTSRHNIAKVMLKTALNNTQMKVISQVSLRFKYLSH